MIIIKSEYFGTGERIKELIEQKFKTQKNFIEKFNEDPKYPLTIRSLSRWISGEVKPTKQNLARTADVLDCDIEFLTCEQDYPKKSNSSKIKLSALSLTEKYLKKIEELMKTTTTCFSFRIGCDIVGGEVYSGTFVDGQTKYYYEDIESEYSKMYYEISVNGGEYKKKTPEETDDFVKSIVKYISYEINQL